MPNGPQMAPSSSEARAGGSPAATTAAPRDVPATFSALYEEAVTCGKCGFCQPTCPVYRATRVEGHVARGKTALFRNIIEGETVMARDLEDAFANCLLCRACTANCFTAVPTDKIVVTFRQEYSRRFGRGMAQRMVFRRLLPHPELMAPLVRAAWRFRRTRVVETARRRGWVALLNPKLERALELAEDPPAGLLRDRLQARSDRRTPASGPANEQQAAPRAPSPSAAPSGAGPAGPRVGYWISCGYNYALPEVGEATVRVLERSGAQVEVLDNVCCGLAAYGYGDLEAAQNLARSNIERLGDLSRYDVIVSECGSCSGQLKDYPELLAGDREFSQRALRLREKVRSFSEFLVESGVPGRLRDEGRPTDAVVTYHEPCHLGARYQGVVSQPREVLGSAPGVTFRELTEADTCCGAAGTFGVLHPETSAAILDRKMGFVEATGANVLVTECPSCMLQLQLGVRRAGLDVTVLNISQVCDSALADMPDPAAVPG